MVCTIKTVTYGNNVVKNSSTAKKVSYRNKALDGFRGLGCILVLIGHTHWNGSTILPGAVVALDLFFVLSGFLITGVLLSEVEKTGSLNLLRFWGRRAVRLFPAFYVYFFIGTAIFFASGYQPIVGTNTLVTLLSTAFYGSNWAYAFGYDLGIFSVTWSLSLEEQFYFICPLFFFIALKYFNKKVAMALLILIIVGVNIHRYELFHSLMDPLGIKLAWRRAFYALDVRGDSLSIGCLSALFYNLYGDKIKFGPIVGALTTVVLIAALFIRDFPLAFNVEETSFYTEFLMTGGLSLFSLLGVIVIIHLVQFPKSIVSKFFSTPFLVHIGVMSYSIYLWHTTVFGGLEILLAPLNSSWYLWSLKAAIRFLVVYGIGFLSFKFVEMPILKYHSKKRKFAPIPSGNQESEKVDLHEGPKL
jgi:peptidoglycan/LPS O-acetylase OafA/YrhL